MVVMLRAERGEPPSVLYPFLEKKCLSRPGVLDLSAIQTHTALSAKGTGPSCQNKACNTDMQECNVKPTPYDKTPDVNIIIWPLNPIKTFIITTNRGLVMRIESKEWPRQDYSPSNIVVLAPETPLKKQTTIRDPASVEDGNHPMGPSGRETEWAITHNK